MSRKLIFLVIILILSVNIVSGLEFDAVKFHSEDDKFFAEVSVKEIFSKDAFDSLKNGQEIKFLLEVSLMEKRTVFPNKKVKSGEEKNIIQYNLVTETYHVVIGKEIKGRKEYLDESLEKAMSDISKFKPVEVFAKSDIKSKSNYTINVNCRVISLKMSPPISFIFDFFFDLNYSVSKSYDYKGREILKNYFN